MKPVHRVCRPVRALCLGAVVCALAAPCALAHEGHVESAPAAVPLFKAAQDEVRARAQARSADTEVLLELLGTPQAPRVRVWVDRFASNAPVLDARVELGVEGRTVALLARDGSYHSDIAPLADGVHAMDIAVIAADSADLLPLRLELTTPAQAVPQAQGIDGGGARALGGVLVATAVLGVALRRTMKGWAARLGRLGRGVWR